jgi:hypothetical protein
MDYRKVIDHEYNPSLTRHAVKTAVCGVLLSAFSNFNIGIILCFIVFFVKRFFNLFVIGSRNCFKAGMMP